MTDVALDCRRPVPSEPLAGVVTRPLTDSHMGPLIAVVIPARNERARLPRCLDAVEVAQAALRDAHPTSPPVRVIVVLDRCTDDSAEVATRPGTEIVITGHGQVGAARAAGVRVAVDTPGLRAADWIACTDADSVVPADWLLTQFDYAAGDADLVLGLVRPDPGELSQGLLHHWQQAHVLRDGHPHVHGANLGVRVGIYHRAGGFPPVAVHEDVLLTRQIRRVGGRVVSTASSPVLTSARLHGRAPAGMAGYLATLAREVGGGATLPDPTDINQ